MALSSDYKYIEYKENWMSTYLKNWVQFESDKDEQF